MGLMVNDSSLWEAGFQVISGLLRLMSLPRFTPALSRAIVLLGRRSQGSHLMVLTLVRRTIQEMPVA